jgi:hypothetical protein
VGRQHRRPPPTAKVGLAARLRCIGGISVVSAAAQRSLPLSAVAGTEGTSGAGPRPCALDDAALDHARRLAADWRTTGLKVVLFERVTTGGARQAYELTVASPATLLSCECRCWRWGSSRWSGPTAWTVAIAVAHPDRGTDAAGAAGERSRRLGVAAGSRYDEAWQQVLAFIDGRATLYAGLNEALAAIEPPDVRLTGPTPGRVASLTRGRRPVAMAVVLLLAAGLWTGHRLMRWPPKPDPAVAESVPAQAAGDAAGPAHAEGLGPPDQAADAARRQEDASSATAPPGPVTSAAGPTTPSDAVPADGPDDARSARGEAPPLEGTEPEAPGGSVPDQPPATGEPSAASDPDDVASPEPRPTGSGELAVPPDTRSGPGYGLLSTAGRPQTRPAGDDASALPAAGSSARRAATEHGTVRMSAVPGSGTAGRVTMPKRLPAGARAGRWAVQVASVRDPANAPGAWQQLAKRYPSLTGLEPRVPRAVIVPDKGTFYRVMGGAFATAAEARAFCDHLRADGADCLVAAF